MKRKKTYIELEKHIYTSPIPVDCPSEDQTMFRLDKKKRLLLDNGIISWLEVGLYLFILVGLTSDLIYSYIQYERKVKYQIEFAENYKNRNKPGFVPFYNPDLADDNLAYSFRSGDEKELRDQAWRQHFSYDIPPTFYVIIISLIALYHGSKRCKDRIVFDRENSTVYYQYFWGLRKVKYSFEETILQAIPIGIHFGVGSFLAIRFPKPNAYAPISSDHPYTSLSFYVWYMDKNRPLPPGELFDSIRESDYLRRKAEGFPLPLFESAIETPEWTDASEKYGDKDGARRASLKLNARLAEYAKDEPLVES